MPKKLNQIAQGIEDRSKEVAVVPPKEMGLKEQVIAEQEKRQVLAAYVKGNMVSGTDFYTLKIGGRETKPSLSKPGSEKVLSLFHWRAEFTKDTETWEMMGSPSGLLCYICKLYTLKDEKLVGEGRGARDSKKDGGDINKAIKMAEKSAQIDAVLRTGGLSDLFTQDVEDMQDTTPISERNDEPFPSKTTQAPRGPKTVIANLLFKLGRDVRKMGGDEADALVLELTKLTMEPIHYAEIETRLGELVSEKKP